MDFQSSLENIRAINRGVSAFLTIGFLEEQMIGEKFSKVLRIFEKKYPNVQLTLSHHSYRSIRDGLYDGSIDIAVTFDMDIDGRDGISKQNTSLLPNSCVEAGFIPVVKVAPSFGTLSLWLDAGYGIFALNKQHVFAHHPALKFVRVKELPPVQQVLAWMSKNPNPAIELFCRECACIFQPDF